MPKRTPKFKDFKIPAGPTSKPKRATMYDINQETKKSLAELRAAARGGRSKKK
jgi:hypothetical protein